MLPPAVQRPRGEALADIGSRIGAMLALFGGSRQFLLYIVALAGPGGTDRYSESGVQAFVACFSLIVGICLAVGLWKQRSWARWTVIVLSAIGAIALVWAAHSNRSSASIGWYACAAGILVGWVLLLERPTTLAKLSIGIILTLASQLGVILILQFNQ